jgi:hypothetical protein
VSSVAQSLGADMPPNPFHLPVASRKGLTQAQESIMWCLIAFSSGISGLVEEELKHNVSC